MKNEKFVHLHVHTEHSLLDGLGKADDYAKRAKKLGFKYLGITDHGNIDGIIRFQKACEKAQIRPVLGCEAYVVPDCHFKVKGERRGHLTFLIRNQAGFKSLCQLLTYANLQGFYHRPRMDYESILNADLSGLILMTACGGSFLMRDGGIDFLEKLVEKGAEIYFEIMPHDIPVQEKLHEQIIALRDDFDIPLVATNDCHYIHEHEWKAQEVLLAIQRKEKWNDPNRWKFGFTGLHLRSADEMIDAFMKQGHFDRKDIIIAMRNTLVIARKCSRFRVRKRPISLPSVPKYQGKDPFAVLSGLAEDGLAKLLKTKKINEFQYDDYKNRMIFELDIINKKNFADYFLIVHELVNWCESEGIGVGPARGSAGGCLVAYLLGIVKIDPLEHGLLFERFISIDREDYPDIDLDFEDTKRAKVRSHLEELYGVNNIASISTFGTMQSRGVIRDVARVFDVPYQDVDEFAKSISTFNDYGDKSPIKVVAENEGRYFAKEYPEVIDIAISLEGQCRNGSQHAAGLIVSANDLTDGERCNLCMRSGNAVVNWEMGDAEYVGLMKLDILGLKTISVINETLRLIGKDIDINSIPLDDEDVFLELSKGNTVGVFQLSAAPTTELCKRVGVREFNDIVAIIALVRPGPMDSGVTDEYIRRRNGLPDGKQWKRKNEIYEEITKETYGMVVFQEQIMQTISKVAGLSGEIANKIRKIIGKKRDAKEFQPYWEMFLEGCLRKQTMDEAEAEQFWEELQSHARYSFNKSHSVAYALIGYQTAWLKQHYPTEFICASLTFGVKSHVSDLIDEAKRIGLEIIPPKVGYSESHQWAAKDGKLYAPFIEIKGVGDKQAEKLARKPQKGKRVGFFDETELPISVSKRGTKLDNILRKLHAYDNTMPDLEATKEYLDFDFETDKSKTYPNLHRVVKKLGLEISDYGYKAFLTGDLQIPLAGAIENTRFEQDRSLLECTKCELSDECRSPVLPSIGLTNVAIIGEAPGRTEDKKGKGFVGNAGKDVLWPTLKKFGHKRREFHVTNVCKCYPKSIGTPTTEHIMACLPWLETELSQIQCKIALGLGNTVVRALTQRSGGITKLNGTVEWIEKYGMWVCWCLHPASCLYSRSNKSEFERGIENFVRFIDNAPF